MTRDIFIRVATAALRQREVPYPEEAAEAIAVRMDIIAEALGETQPPPAAPPPRPAPAAPFPAPNPEAITPVLPPADLPAPTEATGFLDLKYPAPPLVTLETSIPDKIVRSPAPAPPLRSVRPGAGRMKVEDLSRLIQERTPSTLSFDVPMEDGSSLRMTFVRNVISMHNLDSVQLVYYPPNATISARESTEVMKVLHVDDVPFDLPAILKTLAEQAIQSIRPRNIPQSVTPPATSGPVRHPEDHYQDPQVANIQAVFNSLE